jgi:hypothetical protein
MSAFLEITAELEKEKVRKLLDDCPPEFNKLLRLSEDDLTFLIEEGLLNAGTLWEKILEWSGREKHTTGIGADFVDGTDAKNVSVHEWQDPKYSVSKGHYMKDRATATIQGATKKGDLLVSCYSRKRKEYDYLRIPQDLVKSATFSFEYDYNTRELSKRTWVRDYKMSLKKVLCS